LYALFDAQVSNSKRMQHALLAGQPMQRLSLLLGVMCSGRLRGRLRTRHIHHHFDGNVAYGISSPLLDVLLRTNR
jgi:hypothetical protein